MKAFSVLLFVCLPLSLLAQSHWITDSTSAFRLSESSGKPVLLVFSGSDWCKSCIKMDLEVFQVESFQSFADSSLILLKADFPRLRRNRLSEAQRIQNETLASTWNPEGSFPKVILISPEREILYETGYMPGGPVTFIQTIRQVQHESH